jgi:hypothetical protein
MKLTMIQLQDVLAEQLLAIRRTDMDDVERARELENAEFTAKLAKQMINNADIMLRTDKLREEGKLVGSAIDKVVGR